MQPNFYVDTRHFNGHVLGLADEELTAWPVSRTDEILWDEPVGVEMEMIDPFDYLVADAAREVLRLQQTIIELADFVNLSGENGADELVALRRATQQAREKLEGFLLGH